MTLESQALDMARRAQAARQAAADRTAAERSAALSAIASAIDAATPNILRANARDMVVARENGRPAAFLDRLMLNEARLSAIAAAVRQIAAQNDPLGEVIEQWDAPSGVNISQVRVPIGVLGVIFEARPNVTADAAALAVRSGNAVLLRSGSDSLQSALALVRAIRSGLEQAGFPADLVQHPETADRAFVGAMLSGLEGQLDLVIPRGGKALVARVQAEARIPVLGHLDGICHAYLHPSADLDMARAIILNAKLRRTGVCNALECLLVDRAALDTHWLPIARALADAGCEIRADDTLRTAFPDSVSAQDSDWGQEFLDAILAARTVDGLEGAMSHIARYGSGHTDLVLAGDADVQERFLNTVDSAVVMANASTGFSDGGEFGFGAEIGIATSRLHARGPVGARQLTSYKYVVRGQGELRG
ncbi:MAG: glutamate-5-semialdehyde dehydrogenase [Maricaulis sp.]|uniref:glutamate-5-semialdehyde dehydrogenase n=1 Tax=Maricaulis sp. TaxID=1486257 RepID=UPI00262E0A4B|nr:glutamate-5-semialdehyde dehydrogenase [Maricaulis sp.]MDM7985489.1 glutamate-5-semialdehyde dehydrogenase [Maricaulis sp.]